ncbi:hypothetical protein ISN45_Aa06g035910 [Arabidopsis thaliana x Arabidopsis arenosa]|uniref:Uncharacterized protein n=1 Tax=Arabidopsis thaliana x Arabidopsis arenosa TaxID=1240361 RepID=A0A8T1Z2M7_9BRAS|nr:hypothetical protein ISN45_Aa06g035910 [Arabidopsis thaliana x Arabidopsis arenosa]
MNRVINQFSGKLMKEKSVTGSSGGDTTTTLRSAVKESVSSPQSASSSSSSVRRLKGDLESSRFGAAASERLRLELVDLVHLDDTRIVSRLHLR